MKRAFVIALTAAFAWSLIGCGTTGKRGEDAPYQYTPPVLGDVPQFVNDAYQNASEDVLIGVGTYKIGNDMSKMSTGRTFAETRARADISRQLTTIIKDMITDYAATSELDPAAALSFQENITQALSKADLKGARIVTQNTSNGLLWVVMEYSKSAAATDYSAAQSAAKLAVPAAAAFDAMSRMENAFDKAAAGGPVPVGD
ncbi:MAG: hypothetical protein LBF77_10845 [Spirochaetaceae bacterium]|nr:hypothetical protein [Spirochaetaceae bacterium]